MHILDTEMSESPPFTALNALSPYGALGARLMEARLHLQLYQFRLTSLCIFLGSNVPIVCATHASETEQESRKTVA